MYWKGVSKKIRHPETGKEPLLNVKVPLELSHAIDAWAKRYGHTRASAMRLFIEIGLKRRG